jgi:hypothetical protein
LTSGLVVCGGREGLKLVVYGGKGPDSDVFWVLSPA